MTTNTITGTVKDTAGVIGSFSIQAITNTTFTLSAVVVPMVSDIPTKRTITVTPTGGTPPYTFATPVSSLGSIMTPTGQPGQWTFVS